MIEVQLTKKVVIEVPNGTMRIERFRDSYHLEYVNPIYVGSPFRMDTTFSVDFSIPEVLGSPEVKAFLRRFGEG